MTSATNRVRWTTADLDLFPDDGKRYEIIDGELIVTRAPRWSHQQVTGRLFSALDSWSQTTGLGEAAINPGIIFTDEDNVIPDVVWASTERLAALMDEAEHLTGAPELVVEVLSLGKKTSSEIASSNSSCIPNRGYRNIGLWITPCNRCRSTVAIRRC